MDDSSERRQKSTSKVIDSLHSQIDNLKEELETLKISSNDNKKKYTLMSKKNDSLVDQLANAKHENDMINALLKRKERRIVDLEDQYNELSSRNESLNLSNKNMKIRCDNLQESSASSTAEYERLKIAYDALLASQVEYKRHYQKEFQDLSTNFEACKRDSIRKYEELASKLSNNDKDVDTLLDSLTNKRKTMDNLYVSKNKAILELLSSLAKASKLHGEESKNVLQSNIQIVSTLLENRPDLREKGITIEEKKIDIEELLAESNEALVNSSFEEEPASAINSPDLSETSNLSVNSQSKPIERNNTTQLKRKKNKRSSIRFDNKANLEGRNNQFNSSSRLSVTKRANSNSRKNNNTESKTRTPTPPLVNENTNFSGSNRQNSSGSINSNNEVKYMNNSSNTNNAPNNNKSKRRSAAFGSNNNYNQNSISSKIKGGNFDNSANVSIDRKTHNYLANNKD